MKIYCRLLQMRKGDRPSQCEKKLAEISSNLLDQFGKQEIIDKFRTEIKTINFRTDLKRAAVLVPLCYNENSLSLLYTARSKDLRNHRGQISFPGGQADKTDRDMIHTALRETEEEIGFPQNMVEIWGCLKPFPDRMLTTAIFPIVGFVNLSETPLSLNPTEVDAVYTVPVQDLCKKHAYTSFRIHNHRPSRNDYTLPVFLTQPRIWGLTAIVTEFFLATLLGNDISRNYIPSTKMTKLITEPNS